VAVLRSSIEALEMAAWVESSTRPEREADWDQAAGAMITRASILRMPLRVTSMLFDSIALD
jgi:hypothetical protein